ncbi:MAG: hypothetical protein AAFR35_01415 [Pseudomonadota bacterium]
MLTACGPVPFETVERQCAERARQADGPFGEVGVGVNSEDGLRTRLSIGISSDFIAGREPTEVYDSCVRQRTGEPPRTPLVL